jgi:hypothetical protein
MLAGSVIHQVDGGGSSVLTGFAVGTIVQPQTDLWLKVGQIPPQ